MAYAFQIPEGAHHTITAPEHCAWPNLTLLRNGDIGAVIHNQPSHCRMEGDVELWVSEDGGYTWGLRSQITEHEPNTNRLMVAAGLNQDEDIVVLASGHELIEVNGEPMWGPVLDTHVWVSPDQGHTWEMTGRVRVEGEERPCVPHGDICVNGDELVVSVYRLGNAWVMRSGDGGRTWGDASLIAAENYNETDLLITRQGEWLAAVRLTAFPAESEPLPSCGANVLLFTSDDAGRTWEPQRYLSLPGQHPADLLELADGTILVTYGSRIPEFLGVVGRVSEDGGESWSRPFKLAGDCTGSTDIGYPSSVQLADGGIVTAYYNNWNPCYHRYHMGVLRWNLDMVEVAF